MAALLEVGARLADSSLARWLSMVVHTRTTAVLEDLHCHVVLKAWCWTELSLLFAIQAAAEIEHRATLVAILLSLC